jgi:hypothetical protein
MKLPDNELQRSIKRLIDLAYLYAVVWGIIQVIEYVRAF